MSVDIRKVRDMNGLIAYFAETLNWRIDLDDFDDIEDIAYDFEAEISYPYSTAILLPKYSSGLSAVYPIPGKMTANLCNSFSMLLSPAFSSIVLLLRNSPAAAAVFFAGVTILHNLFEFHVLPPLAYYLFLICPLPDSRKRMTRNPPGFPA